MFTLTTFGDSILDCGGYNAYGLHPAGLILQNDDARFPEFHGRDLLSRGRARIDHRAVDGSTVHDLAFQAVDLVDDGPGVALLTVGGNDLIFSLANDRGDGLDAFADVLEDFLRSIPIRPVLIGTVYDPTFGDDSRNFLGVDPDLARANFQRVNGVLAEAAARYGALIDLHAHFLTGDSSWFTNIIEPSLKGASEIRRCFLPAVLEQFRTSRS